MGDETPRRRVRVKPEALAAVKKERRAKRRAERPAQPPVKGSGPGGSWRILALDSSSTNIGAVLLQNRQVLRTRSVTLKGTPASRLVEGGKWIDDLLWLLRATGTDADVLAIEAPAQRPVGHGDGGGGGIYNIIAQQRMVGVLLYLWHQFYPGRPVVEVGPLQAKKALTGSGVPKVATKQRMIACAKEQAPAVEWSEHCADAFGVGLWACGEIERWRDVAASAPPAKRRAS